MTGNEAVYGRLTILFNSLLSSHVDNMIMLRCFTASLNFSLGFVKKSYLQKCNCV